MTATFPDGELEDAAELGAVDDRGVRLWVRRPGAARATARLEVEGLPPVEGAVALSGGDDWTGVVALSLPEPAPDRPFRVTSGGRTLIGCLAPAPETHAGLTFGFGSCHQPFVVRADTVTINPAAAMYPAMLRELRSAAARFVLLLGDQIYSDALAVLTVRPEDMDGREPLAADTALAAYRRVYRVFFAQAGFRALREAFPTYCTWDDHEIFNDWGSLLDESDDDRLLFTAAARAYREYQHQRNPGGAAAPPFHYSFRHGDIGFLVLDLRGARDYDEGRLMGASQWRAVQEYLRGDDARTIQTLFVVSGVPVAHVARWFVALFQRLPIRRAASVRDRWCSAAFAGNRDELLDELFTWQTAAPARQVIVLSGDVHAASAFTIRRRHGPGVIRQFTSSAFTSRLGLVERVLNTVVVHGANFMEPRWRFRFHFLSLRNNYGLVRVEPLARGGHRVSFTVRAWRPRERALVSAGRLTSRPPLP